MHHSYSPLSEPIYVYNALLTVQLISHHSFQTIENICRCPTRWTFKLNHFQQLYILMLRMLLS